MMKKIYLLATLVVACVFLLPQKSYAQACATCAGVTTFTANLSASPNNTYTVTSTRNGLCCQGTGSDRCVRFEVTVHPLATQIQFLVSTGNNGTWQINCAAPLYTPASQPCLSGLTSFCITYCNPGGSADTYTITTSSGFSAGADLNLRAGCAGLLTVGGLNESSITWNSVAPGAVGQYNSYLSCLSACDSSTVTPAAGAPAFVDYRVCGTAVGCTSGTYCDTQRVYISPALTVSITPTTPAICSGGSGSVTLTATPTGGTSPFTYSWAPGGATTQTVSVSSAGTYSVSVNDQATGCGAVTQTVSVASVTTPTATATPGSETICSGGTTNIALSSSTPGTTFSWTVTQSGVSGASAGSGATIAQALTTTGATAGTATYTITPTANGCVGNPITVIVTVNPTPTAIATPNSQTLCSGGASNIALTSNVAGTTFSWTVTQSGITGASASSGSAIAQSLSTVSTVAGTATYTITPSASACPGTPITATVTVNPAPVMTSASSATVCSGVALNIPLTADVASTFSWIAANNANTTGESTTAQSTNTINNTITNSTTSAQTVSYTVTPTSSAGSCPGTPQTVLVTVNPTPAMTSASTATICSGGTVSIPLTANVASAFTWIAADNANTTGESTTSQNTSTLSNTITNTSTSVQTVVYTVTPTSSAGSCAGPAQTVSVTVNPTAAMTSANSATICSGGTVSIPLTSNIAATYTWIAADNANTTGESTTSQSTSTLSNTITNSTTSAQTVIYTVTPSAGSCPGTPQTVTVTVNPAPAMTSASSATICSGGTVSIPLTANIASGFTWIAGDNANTSGESTSLQSTSTLSNTITNGTTTLQSVVYTVTPTSTAGSCAGTPQTVTVSVNPTPAVTSASSATICSGGTVSITLTANVASTFTWIASDNANTTGESTTTQSTSTLSNTITNNTSSVQTVTYTVTPTSSAATCPGTPQTVTVTINPIPAMTSANSASICSGATVNIPLTANIPSTFTWIAANNANTSGESTTTQSTATLSNTITNATTSAQTVTYTVTPTSSAGSCPGTPQTVSVTVNPTPAMTSASSASICSGGTVSIPLTSNVASTFTWIAGDNANTSGESTTSQSTNTISNTITSTGGNVETVTYTVTPTSTGGSCTGNPQTVTVTVNPTPAMTSANSASICSGQTVNIPLTSSIPSTFTWIASDNANTTGESTTLQTTSTLSNVISSSSASPQTVTYTVTPTATTGGCPGTAQIVTVTVNPIPAPPVASNNGPVCLNGTVNLSATLISGATYSWTGPNGFVSSQQNPTINNVTATEAGTYSVSVTVAGCTSTIGTTAVAINPPPTTPSPSSNSPVCSGQTLTLTTNTITAATYSWTGPNGFVSSTQNPSITNVTTAAGGTYSVVANVPGCGSSAAGTVAVTVNATPATPTTTANGPLCVGATLNLTASNIAGATYSWTGPNAFTSSTQNPSITNVTTAASGTYSVTATANGCTSIAGTVTVVINAIPLPPNANSNSPVCLGNTLNLTASVVSGATYSWTGPNAFSSSLQNPSITNVTTSASGTYTVTATVAGCTSPTATVDVTVNAVPVAPTASGTVICQGTSDTLTATAPGGTYQWYTAPSGGTLLGSGASFVTPTLTASTSYYVQTTVNGCPGPRTQVTVTVSPVPAAPTVSGTTICEGLTTTLNATAPGGAYAWYDAPSGGTLLSSNSSYTTSTLTTTTTYYVNTTMAGCTSANTAVTVTVTPTDDPTFSYSSGTYCQTGTNPTPSITGGFTGTFSATPAGLVFTNTSTGTINLAASALNTYTVTFTTNGPCPSSSTMNITVTTAPDASFSYSTPFCQNGTNPLPSFPAGASAGVFSSNPAGLTFVNTSSGEVDLTASTPGTYTLTNFIAAAGGCASANATNTITINPMATVNAGADQIICDGSTVTLAGALGGSATNATWSGGTGSFSNSSLLNAVYTPGAAENSVTLVLTTNDPAGPCSSVTDTMQITINPIPVAPTASGTTICAGNTASLDATAPGGSYSWYDSPSAGTLVGTGSNFITPTLTTTTTYYVETTVGGCAGPRTAVTVTVNPIPASPTAPGISICTGNAGMVSATAPGGSYEWYDAASGGTLLASNASMTTPTLTATTTYYVQTTINGCTSPVTAVTVTVNPYPVAPTALNDSTCDGSAALLTATAPGGSYEWYDAASGGTLLFTGANFTTPALTVTTTYYVQTTVNGCTGPRTAVTAGVIPIPSAPTATGTSVCSGTAATLNASAPGGTYTWFTQPTGGTQIGTGAAFTTSTLTTTSTFYVQTTVSGCSSPRTAVTATVIPIDDPSFNYSSGTYCITGTNPVPSITGGSTGAFTASPAGLVFVNASTGEIDLASSTLNTYTVTFTTNGTCPATATTIVTVTNAPDATFSYNGPYCPSGTDPLPSFSSGASAGIFSASPAGLVFTNTSTGLIDLSASTPGTYTVTNNIAAAGGCAATSATNTITINPGPTVNAGTDVTACIGSPVTLSGAFGGTAISATWSGGNGSFSNTSDLNATYTPAAGETSVTITLTTDDPPGVCPAISDNLIITFTQDTGAVTYSSGTYCISGTNPLPSTNGYAGTFTASPAGLTFVSAGTGEIDLASSALNTYTVSFTTNGTCPNTSTVTVTITNSPDATFSYSGPYCQSDVNPLPVFNAGASAGTFSSVPSGLNFTNSTTGEIDLANSAAGTYTVTNNIAASGGCIAVSYTTTVAVHEKPTANAGTDQSICDGSTVTLSGTIGGTASSATWSGGTGSFSNAATLNTVYTPAAGETAVIIILTTNDPAGPCAITADTMTVTINPIPSAPAASGISICSGTSDTLTATAPGGTYSWYDAPAAGTLLGTGSTFVTPILNDTTTYYVESTMLGCTGPRTAVTVTVVPGPVANAGSDQTLCSNNSVITLNGSVTNAGGGVWATTGDGTFSNDSTLITVYTPGATDLVAGSVSILLTSTNNGGCTAVTDTLNAVFTPAPLPDAGSDLFVCKGNTAVTLSGAVGGATSTGQWTTLGSGTFTPNDSSLSASYNFSNADTTAGMITLVLTSTNNGNCNAETDTVIITLTTPAFASAGADSTICFNTSITLNGLVTGGSVQGVWTSSGNGTFSPDSSALNATYTPGTADAGLGTVLLVLTPVNSCQNNPDTVTLNILPAPVVNAGSNMAVCAGTTTVSLNGSVSGATTTGVWSTSGTGTFSPDSTALNAVYSISSADSTSGTVTLVLTSTNNATCNAETDSIVITISNNVFPFAGNDTSVCANNALIALNGSVTGGSSGVIWTSSGAGIFSPNDSSLAVTYQPDTADIANGSVTFVMTPQNSCTPTADTVVISITPAPVVNAGVNTTVCSSAPTVNLSGSSNGIAGGVVWTSSGSGTFSPSDTTLNSTYTFAGADSDTLAFILTSTGNGGCNSASDTVFIIRGPAPVAAFNFSNSCSGQSVTFTDATVGSVSMWNWNFGTGDTSSLQNPTYVFTSSGTYTVSLISSAGSNCSDTISQVIVVNPLPVAAFSFAATCAGTAAQFTDNSTIGSGTINSWNWNFGDSTTEIVQNPLHIFTSGGNYNVSLTVTSDSGCTASATQTVSINPNPVAGFTSSVPCNSFDAAFTDTSSVSSGTIATWNWTFGDGNTSSQQNPSNQYANSGTYTVTLVVESGAGCSDTASVVISVADAVVADYTPQGGSFNPGQSIQFTNQSTGATVYGWDFADGTSTDTDPQHAYTLPGTYTVTLIASNSGGCADTVAYVFSIEETGYVIPTGFTPNGDGKNDFFYVRGGPFSDYELRVFNEWGQEIFMSTNQNTMWDGSFKGAGQPSGTYIYVFIGKTVSGEEVKEQGEINLIR